MDEVTSRGIDVTGLPETALQARTTLAAASVGDLKALAERFLQGHVRPGQAAEIVFVRQLAGRLDADARPP